MEPPVAKLPSASTVFTVEPLLIYEPVPADAPIWLVPLRVVVEAVRPIAIVVAFELPTFTVPLEPESKVTWLDAAVGPIVRLPVSVLQVEVACPVSVSACEAAACTVAPLAAPNCNPLEVNVLVL